MMNNCFICVRVASMPPEAHAFLTYAFAADAINRISHEAIRAAINQRVVERLHEVAPG